tara:strand:- start:280 stop:516 length:237 start_codon:yes stop_codon:yes gene_type:complete
LSRFSNSLIGAWIEAMASILARGSDSYSEVDSESIKSLILLAKTVSILLIVFPFILTLSYFKLDYSSWSADFTVLRKF